MLLPAALPRMLAPAVRLQDMLLLEVLRPEVPLSKMLLPAPLLLRTAGF